QQGPARVVGGGAEASAERGGAASGGAGEGRRGRQVASRSRRRYQEAAGSAPGGCGQEDEVGGGLRGSDSRCQPEARRDVDMEDSRICAETPNSKARLSQNTVDQASVASDLSMELRKLKRAYETLSSQKDMEVSTLLSEKELARNQLVVMRKTYNAILRNKNGEAAQTSEAAQKLQRSVDDLKVSAQKKDDEISRLRAEAVAAEKKLQIAQKLQQSVDDLKAAAQKKDDEIDRLRAEAVAAEKKLREMQSLVKEKDDEIQTINDGQDETNQKRRRVSSTSNDDEQSESVEDDDVQSGSDEDGDEQSESDEDGDEQSRSDDNCDEQSRSDDDDLQSRSNNQVRKPLSKPKRKRDACNAQVANSNNQSKICQSIPRRHYLTRMAPKPLRSRKLRIVNGQRCLEGTGHWGKYVRLVNDSLADQPDKHKEFVTFLRFFRICSFAEFVIRPVPRKRH
uniref:Uncharacterized protein n=1 Tax=Aegilops tauschii subsp. strangulata TaxID=200361 RepID=A0A453MX37_AEGTS